ncbi:uncharacterized protein LOC116614325 [Nematostella vectensis]|uniref:uncharacterized protein LOC116614325 n=1 Tax=Nematostella vectensis TaxID=45351 RepID=UPI0020772431|nr:uncharacterized protein LOC116614325 [Nematostella vectensis]XP_032231082.2 uncharacterized protein LOC116614325 [Nematostella vectensis]
MKLWVVLLLMSIMAASGAEPIPKEASHQSHEAEVQPDIDEYQGYGRDTTANDDSDSPPDPNPISGGTMDDTPKAKPSKNKQNTFDNIVKLPTVKAKHHPDEHDMSAMSHDAPVENKENEIARVSPETKDEKKLSVRAWGRKREYQSWSAWEIYRVPYEYDFPDYHQFKYGGCQVGCGPVAWAQVFGYYDRVSGWSSSLYPHGRAPKYLYSNDNNLKKYIVSINKRMRTFCLGSSGATFPSGMKLVRDFFRARQGSGGIWSYTHWLSWAGVTKTWIRKKVSRAIKTYKYPVVVGIWTGGSMHYAVATKYAVRSRKFRTCHKIWGRWKCYPWRTQWEDDFYLHMGWGGTSNGWYTIHAFAAFVAHK